MELMKKHIHMERTKCRANTQITMEEDVNISDQKPDVKHMIMDSGKVEFEELRAMQDAMIAKGKLWYKAMYLSDESEKQLCCVEGSIAFEEKVNMEGLIPGDSVSGKAELEDLSIELINSRKLSIRSLLNLIFTVDELYTKEAAVDVANQENLQIQKEQLELSCIEVQKKDIFRVKEEIEIPSGYPNIFQLLWKSCKVTSLEWKLLQEKISIQGECSVFFLYEAEGENRLTRWYETTIVFSGLMECQGCSEELVGNIIARIEHLDMDVKPDYDGEERVVGLELVLDLDMKLFHTREMEMITDVYGITNEVTPLIEEEEYKNLLLKNIGKTKVVQNLKTRPGEERIFQICYGDGEVLLEHTEISENKIDVYGVILLQILYVTGNDEMPYSCMKRSVPFSYSLDVQDISMTSTYYLDAMLEQLTITMLDGEEVEVKGMVSCKAIVFETKKTNIVTGITVDEIDMKRMNELPSIVAYIAEEGDTIWNVGKRYYVPISSIQETNNLQGNNLKAGERILVVKEMTVAGNYL